MLIGKGVAMVRCWYFHRRMSSGPASPATWSHGLIGLLIIFYHKSTFSIHEQLFTNNLTPPTYFFPTLMDIFVTIWISRCPLVLFKYKKNYSLNILFVWKNKWIFSIPRLEKESFKTLDKPQSFAHAQEIEKEAVLFAKEVNFHFSCQTPFFSNHIKSHSFIDQVRKANKLLGTLSGSVDQLPSKKMYSGQQIDDQKAR